MNDKVNVDTFVNDQSEANSLEAIISDQPVNGRLSTTSFILTLLALAFGVFCVALDNVIIVAAIPRITDTFHTLNDIGWYGSAYLLPTCAFQPVFGKLYSRYSAKWTYSFAILSFEIGSLISATSTSSVMFIVGRAISGLGAAGLLSGAFIIIAILTPIEKTAAFQGIIGAMFGVSSIVAPLLGGVFTEDITWRLCFYINLPIGLFSFAVLLWCLKIPSPQRTALRWRDLVWSFDPVGIVLFMSSTICLLVVLQWGGITHPWNSWQMILLLVGFVVLLAGFVVTQGWIGEIATIPPWIRKQRTVVAVSCFIPCIFGQFTINLYFIPVVFQTTRGATAVEAGIHVVPLVAATVLTSLIVGFLCSKVRQHVLFFYACSILSSIGCGLLVTCDEKTSSTKWTGYQIVAGVGTGFALQLPAVAVQQVLEQQNISVGIAYVLMMEFFGASVFFSVANNVFNSKLLQNINALDVPGLDGTSLIREGATSIRHLAPAKYVPELLRACMQSLRWVFVVAVILASLSILGVFGMEMTAKSPVECNSDGKEPEAKAQEQV